MSDIPPMNDESQPFGWSPLLTEIQFPTTAPIYQRTVLENESQMILCVIIGRIFIPAIWLCCPYEEGMPWYPRTGLPPGNIEPVIVELILILVLFVV